MLQREERGKKLSVTYKKSASSNMWKKVPALPMFFRDVTFQAWCEVHVRITAFLTCLFQHLCIVQLLE